MKRTIVTIVDDIDGTHLPEGQGETVFFSIDGADYEIDLSDYNAGKLRSFLALFADKARRVEESAPTSRARQRSPQQEASQPRARRPKPSTATPEGRRLLELRALDDPSPEEWAELAPNPSDREDLAHGKLLAWCKIRGLTARGRGGAEKHQAAYTEFYTSSRWSIPKDSDLETGTGKAAAAAARRRAKVVPIKEKAS